MSKSSIKMESTNVNLTLLFKVVHTYVPLSGVRTSM